jgi:hypothetical protein
MIDESAVNEAEIHDFGRSREMEIVAVAPAAEPVGALEKFVADTDAPFGRKRRDIGDFLEVKIFGVITADDHGERVFETEGLGDFEMEALGVELFDAKVDGVRIPLRGFVEDSGESGAGVLDIKIELAGFEGFVDEERAAEIRLALDGDAGFGFNVLGQKFGKDHLLGEKFGTDGDFGLRRIVAGGEEVDEVQEIEEVKESEGSAAHVRSMCSSGKSEMNLTQGTENTEH